MVDVRLVEWSIRTDLVAAARAERARRDVPLATVVGWAIEDYLRQPGPVPVLVDARRSRLPVRLPVVLLAQLDEQAGQVRVGPRLLVEEALGRAFRPARGPGWQPNARLPEPD